MNQMKRMGLCCQKGKLSENNKAIDVTNDLNRLNYFTKEEYLFVGCIEVELGSLYGLWINVVSSDDES